MTPTTLPGGTFTLADDLTLTRVGYGAMQLAGPHVFGPPADHDDGIAKRQMPNQRMNATNLCER
jgi:pyridoxine 4-dehydrogenase